MNLGMPEIIIIAIVVLLLFGGKKLPELMHGVGKGIHDFKRSVNGIEEDIKKDIDAAGTTDNAAKPAEKPAEKLPDNTATQEQKDDTTTPEQKAS